MSSVRIAFAYFLLAIFAIHAGAPPSWTQANSSPTSVPIITTGPTAIGARNIQQLRALIIPELQLLVRAGAVELTAYPKLEYDLSKPQRHPFIERLLNGVASSKIDSLSTLWSGQALWWGKRILQASFELDWLHELTVSGQVHGQLTRIFMHTDGSNTAPDQYFREILTIREPAPLLGLRYLTFRFFGEEEDLLWLFSPALKKTRQLTGSNRSDPIFNSSLSLDDLFVWSGKPELLEVSASQELTTLAAFHALTAKDVVPAKGPGECSVVFHDSEGEPGAIGAPSSHDEIRAWGGLSDLSNAFFVPRPVRRIDLLPTDPFSLYARQILYIDSESGLPHYKLVYDRTGSLWKIVIGIAGFSQGSDHQLSPYFSKVLSIDKLNQVVSIFSYRSLVSCAEFNDKVQLKQFDPSHLDSEATK